MLRAERTCALIRVVPWVCAIAVLAACDTTAPGAPAAIALASSTQLTGTVGQVLTSPPRIQIRDAKGRAVSGVAFSVTVAQGSGTLTGSPSSTTGGSTSLGSWTLGTVAGPQTLVVASPGLTSLTITVTANAGPPASLRANTSSLTAESLIGTPATLLPSVTAFDAFGNPVSGLAVGVAVSGGGSVQNNAPVTDASGAASTGAWTLGPSVGTQTVTMSAGSAPPVVFTTTVFESFNVTIRYIGTPPAPNVQAAFTAAANRLQQEIIRGLPDTVINANANGCLAGAGVLSEPVDDVLILVSINSAPPFDGVGGLLGFAGPCDQRTGSPYLPYIGVMEFDAADVPTYVAQGLFSDIVLHEMHHVLGFGTNWPPVGFGWLTLSGLTQGYGSPNPLFLGSQTRAAYLAAGGTAAVGVPLDNTGVPGDGTNFSHWRELVFRNELMTGYYGPPPNPLSAITIASMGDIGYRVNLGAGDPYTVPAPGQAAAGLRAAGPLTHIPERQLGHTMFFFTPGTDSSTVLRSSAAAQNPRGRGSIRR